MPVNINLFLNLLDNLLPSQFLNFLWALFLMMLVYNYVLPEDGIKDGTLVLIYASLNNVALLLNHIPMNCLYQMLVALIPVIPQNTYKCYIGISILHATQYTIYKRIRHSDY